VLGKCNDCSKKLACLDIAWNDPKMKDKSSRDKLNCLLGPIFLDMSTKRIFTLPDEAVNCIFYTSVKRAVMVKTLYEQTPNHVMVSTTNLVKFPDDFLELQSFQSFKKNATIEGENELYDHYIQHYWTQTSSNSSSSIGKRQADNNSSPAGKKKPSGNDDERTKRQADNNSSPAGKKKPSGNDSDQTIGKKRIAEDISKSSLISNSFTSNSMIFIDQLDDLHFYKFNDRTAYLSSILCADALRLLGGKKEVWPLTQIITVKRQPEYIIKTIIKQRRFTNDCKSDLLQIQFILSLNNIEMVILVEEKYTDLTTWEFSLDQYSDSINHFKRIHCHDVFTSCFGALLTRVALLLNGITYTLLCFITILVTCCCFFILYSNSHCSRGGGGVWSKSKKFLYIGLIRFFKP
jgi:hypothetical protein